MHQVVAGCGSRCCPLIVFSHGHVPVVTDTPLHPGGYDSTQYYQGVWAFDLTQLTTLGSPWLGTQWVPIVNETATNCPSARTGHSLTVYEDKVYLVRSPCRQGDSPFVCVLCPGAACDHSLFAVKCALDPFAAVCGVLLIMLNQPVLRPPAHTVACALSSACCVRKLHVFLAIFAGFC